MRINIIILIIIACILSSCTENSTNPPPNILWIVSEDNSPFLGCYGDELAHTPNLDKLADQGILYTRAYATAPVCAPARSTLITGMYPPAIGTENMRSYDIDGILWRTERMGPISDILGFTHTGRITPAVSFDEFTRERAKTKGINIDQAIKGFRVLTAFADDCRAGKEPLDGHYVTFWRICLEYPEILAWEMLWIEALRDTYKEVYEFVKSIRPEVEVGSALSFKGIYNPFYRARQDLQELSKYADFLKIVMYYNVGGVRMHTFINGSGKTLYGDMEDQERLDFVNSIMGYDDSKYDELERTGLPHSMIENETKRALKGAEGTNTKILPAIDIDIPARRFEKIDPVYSRCTPESTRDAVKAVFNSRAEGIILARKYSEMNLSNLAGVGQALKDMRIL
jgi:hypothetical protein